MAENLNPDALACPLPPKTLVADVLPLLPPNTLVALVSPLVLVPDCASLSAPSTFTPKLHPSFNAWKPPLFFTCTSLDDDSWSLVEDGKVPILEE